MFPFHTGKCSQFLKRQFIMFTNFKSQFRIFHQDSFLANHILRFLSTDRISLREDVSKSYISLKHWQFNPFFGRDSVPHHKRGKQWEKRGNSAQKLDQILALGSFIANHVFFSSKGSSMPTEFYWEKMLAQAISVSDIGS